jgi:hypothetical protein
MPATHLPELAKQSHTKSPEHLVLTLVIQGVAFSVQQALLVGESDRMARTPSPPEATAAILRHMRHGGLSELEILTTFGSAKEVKRILEELGFSAEIVKIKQVGYTSERLFVSDPDDRLVFHFWEKHL